MHTGVPAGHVPQLSEPPQPSSTAPQCVPPGQVVSGTQVVEVVLEVVLEVVAAVLVELVVVLMGEMAVVEVVGVIKGVEPQFGGVGSLLVRHIFMSALRVRLHADRHCRPDFPFGHALLQSFRCVVINRLQALGQWPASTPGVSRNTTRSTMTDRMFGPPLSGVWATDRR
jgi:hypothetical protein